LLEGSFPVRSIVYPHHQNGAWMFLGFVVPQKLRRQIPTAG